MQIYRIPEAPEAIGPYSHAIRSGNLVFCSGQTPLDPATMHLTGTTIGEQTERVLENLTIVNNRFSQRHDRFPRHERGLHTSFWIPQTCPVNDCCQAKSSRRAC